MSALHTAAAVAVAVVALEHLCILVLEMFLWTRPGTLRIFGLSPELAQSTRSLAANLGLYNGFLAAGLLYALATGQRQFVQFFLLCVVVAGVYGGLTARPRIALVQAVPAALALALTWFSV